MALTRVTGNLIVSGVTLTSPAITGNLTLSGGTANGVTYLNGSKVLTSGSALNFDGTNFVLNNGSIRANNTLGYYTNLTATGLTNSGTTMDFDSVSSYLFKIATAEKMRLDASGNLGLGVTPSAWNSGVFKTIQINAQGSLFATSTSMQVGNNIYYDSDYKFIGTGYATRYYQASGEHAWRVSTASGTAGGTITETQVMTLTAAGNLGVGTTSPINNGGYGGFSLNGTSGALLSMMTGGTESSRIVSIDNETSIQSKATTGFITFVQGVSGGTERARIDSSGNFTVGGTTSYGRITGVNATGTQLATNATQSGNGVQSGIGFYNQGTFRVTLYHLSTDNALYVVADSNGVKLNPTATSWTSASDERLKDIIEPIADAATKVSTLRAVIGKYKTDAEGTRRSFLIAQDIQAVLPEAVDISNPENLGVQYTEVIPLLVAAIKEQTTLIESLKARLDAANL